MPQSVGGYNWDDDLRTGLGWDPTFLGTVTPLIGVSEPEDGVGSDLNVVVIVEDSNQAFERRSASWDITGLPVPADLLVYTEREWKALDPARKFTKMLLRETVWIYGGPGT